MHWNVDPIIFSIGGFGLRYYPLMFILGISLGYMYVRKRLEKNGMTKEHAESMQNYIIAGMIIGARLGHCLFYDPEYYLSNPLEIIKVWKGGLASHGGFLGVLFAIYLFSRKWREKPYFWFIESILPPTVMTAGFIRLGNLFNSEILGKVTDVPWAFTFTGENTPVPHLPRHPAQLYESIAFFSIAFLLHILWKRNVETGKWHLGKGLGLTFILTFSARFLIEFLKIEQSDFEKGMILNMGQILSIPFVLVGAYLFFVNIEKIKGFDFLTKVKAKQKIKTTVKSKPKVTKNKKNRKKKRK